MISKSSELERWLENVINQKGIRMILVSDADTAAILISKAVRGKKGIGFKDTIYVFYHGQIQFRESQWKSHLTPLKDRLELAIDGIRKISVVKADSRSLVKVELLNIEYPDREISFEFLA